MNDYIYTETDPSNKNVCHLHLIEGAMNKLCPFFVGLFHRQQISGVPASIRSWQSELENSVCGLISPGVQDMLGTCRFVAVIIQACVVYCLVYSTMAGKFWRILRLNLQVASTMASWTRLKKVGSIDLYMGLWYMAKPLKFPLIFHLFKVILDFLLMGFITIKPPFW